MKYLPDTKPCIALMRRNARVRGRMESLAPGDCAVSVITALELHHGLERCAQREREQAKIDEVFSVFERSIHPPHPSLLANHRPRFRPLPRGKYEV